jgi:hypothetical protein
MAKNEPVPAHLLESYRKDDSTLNYMMKEGMPLTRSNYIGMNWGGQAPSPWLPHHEEEVPEPMRDWSRVQGEPPQET